MSNYLSINIVNDCLEIIPGSFVDVDISKEVISRSDLGVISLSRDESIITVNISNRLTWKISSTPEYVEGTFPVELWDSVAVLTTKDLFSKISNFKTSTV